MKWPTKWIAYGVLGLTCAACGGGGASSGYRNGDAGQSDAAPTLNDGAPVSGDALSLGDGSGGEGGSGQVAEVFGQSADTLYKLDPGSKAVTVVGPFQGCSQVIDIALDKDSNMYATTFNSFYKVDRNTAQCTQIASGSVYPNSLSFVPAGTLDPNAEKLVGYNVDQYITIDTQTGVITNVGTAIGMGLSSSGDIVSVKGGGTYLTVNCLGGGSCPCTTDCLIQVDPSTGSFLKNWGPTGHTNVFGIAFWAGAVYGFDDGGNLFQIDFNGAAMQITAIPVPNPPPMLQFWGAGSTTSAPVNPNK
jgi:hypothetical protein